jgi:cation diffusion facilitator family transporter
VEKRQVALLAIAGGILVLLLKVLAYLVSNSVALLSDAMESIINIVASIMMFVALTIAARPEDESHRYGYQKAENISALIEGLLVIIAAVLIVEACIGRLADPVAFTNIDQGLAISLLATSLNGLLAVIMLREARKSRSMALEGDAKHLFSDVMSSIGVVVGLFIASITGIYILDPIIALVVAALLVKMGIDVFRKTSRDLMDSSCPDEEKDITSVLDKNKDILEYHELKTRRSGHKVFMDVHICINGSVPLSEAHSISDRLEMELKEAVPGIIPNIHIEDHNYCEKQVKNETAPSPTKTSNTPIIKDDRIND